ncbi:MAG: ferrous iron transport protein A [Clostridia bacterium]|nr:ferrous iron transport protein A [Clostridia bacterium]
MNDSRSLNDLSAGESATVKEILSRGSLRRRFLDIGLVEDTVVTCVGESPLGDPAAFEIRGAVIAIRRSDCKDIKVK